MNMPVAAGSRSNSALLQYEAEREVKVKHGGMYDWRS